MELERSTESLPNTIYLNRRDARSRNQSLFLSSRHLCKADCNTSRRPEPCKRRKRARTFRIYLPFEPPGLDLKWILRISESWMPQVTRRSVEKQIFSRAAMPLSGVEGS